MADDPAPVPPIEPPVEPVIPETPEVPDIPEIPESPRPESPTLAEPPPAPSPSPVSPSSIVPPDIPNLPDISDLPNTPIVPPVDFSSQISAALKAEQDSRRVLANQARKKQKDDRLNKILEFVRDHGSISNDQTRDLLHVSQSTATGYLTELAKRGMLNIEGKGNATCYRSNMTT